MTIAVAATSHAAWFAGTLDATFTVAGHDGHATLRATGIAVERRGAWKLAAIDFARTLPDSALWKLADANAAKPKHAPSSSDAPTAVVLAWFAGTPIAKSRAATAIARGTAPGETATTAAADANPANAGSAASPQAVRSSIDKLAAAWDGIHMWAAWGSIAYVRASIGLPAKAGGAVLLEARVVLVLDGGDWKWAVIDFAPPLPR